MPEPHAVCRVSDLPPGSRKLIEIGGRSIGVFNVHGEFYAIRNLCPHQFAPLCLGNVTGTTAPGAVGEYRWERDGEIVRCPWHGWEFDIKTGRSLFNPHKVRVKSYQVMVEPPAGGSAEMREVSTDDPDPAVETFTVEARDGTVFVIA